jgi:dTDP-4-dehydrorhamnose 3,5-epimerase-like enzyme
MSHTIYQPTEAMKLAENVYKTGIDGLFYLTYPRYIDDRGLFSDFYKIPKINQILGTDFTIKQLNYAYSVPKVIRGMHAEGWNKLITVLSGHAFCALADIRPESPTFLKTEYFEFAFDPASKQGAGLYITKGIGNSICAPTDPVGYLYAVDMLYEERDTSGDRAISIYDPDLAIEWPVPKDVAIISDRDKNSITVRELYPEKF